MNQGVLCFLSLIFEVSNRLKPSEANRTNPKASDIQKILSSQIDEVQFMPSQIPVDWSHPGSGTLQQS